jgi:hypothetical protein
MIFKRKSKPPPAPYAGPTIKAAAILFDGLCMTGRNHAEIMGKIWDKHTTDVHIPQDTQGFLTSAGAKSVPIEVNHGCSLGAVDLVHHIQGGRCRCVGSASQSRRDISKMLRLWSDGQEKTQ